MPRPMRLPGDERPRKADPKPERPFRKATQFRVRQDLFDKLRRRAAANRRPITNELELAIEAYLS